MRPLVPFADEPYAPDGPVDAGAFLKCVAGLLLPHRNALPLLQPAHPGVLLLANMHMPSAAAAPNAY
jgi:hypothetical protein